MKQFFAFCDPGWLGRLGKMLRTDAKRHVMLVIRGRVVHWDRETCEVTSSAQDAGEGAVLYGRFFEEVAPISRESWRRLGRHSRQKEAPKRIRAEVDRRADSDDQGDEG